MYNLYSVYDRKAKQFSMPVAQNNDETAKRWFEYIVSNSDMVAKDLELYLIGKFDSVSGSIVVYDRTDQNSGYYGIADFICSADELVKEVKENE